MHEVIINGKSFFIEEQDTNLASIEKLNDKTYHIIFNNKSFLFEIEHINKEKGEVTLSRRNRLKLSAQIISPLQKQIGALGLDRSSKSTQGKILAPMPGLVLKLLVKAGDIVSTGDGLLILEAMKMENVIKAPNNGKIKNVAVSPLQTIDKNQVLVEFE